MLLQLCLVVLVRRVKQRLVEVHSIHIVLHVVEVLGQLHDALHSRGQLVAGGALRRARRHRLGVARDVSELAGVGLEEHAELLFRLEGELLEH